MRFARLSSRWWPRVGRIGVMAGVAIWLSAAGAGATSGGRFPGPAFADRRARVARPNAPAPGPYADYAWVIDPHRRAELVRLIGGFDFGENVDDVICLLGEPDGDHEGGVKTIGRRRQHRRRHLSYDVARFGDLGSNMLKDETVTLWFDADGRLEIVSSSVPGILKREAPGAMSDEPAPLKPGTLVPRSMRWIMPKAD